jgi:hypothetical protein
MSKLGRLTRALLASVLARQVALTAVKSGLPGDPRGGNESAGVLEQIQGSPSAGRALIGFLLAARRRVRRRALNLRCVLSRKWLKMVEGAESLFYELFVVNDVEVALVFLITASGVLLT